MASGRSIAGVMSGIWVAIICLFLLSHLQIIESKEFKVGDASGWTFKVSNWPKNKTFHAGDVLVFKYSPSAHNVVEVDAEGYNNCKAGPNAIVHQSGNDSITVKTGANYFLCSFSGHCNLGVKIIVNAM